MLSSSGAGVPAALQWPPRGTVPSGQAPPRQPFEQAGAVQGETSGSELVAASDTSSHSSLGAWVNRPQEVAKDLLHGVVDVRYEGRRFLSRIFCCCGRRVTEDDRRHGMSLSCVCLAIVIALMMLLAFCGLVLNTLVSLYNIFILPIRRWILRSYSILKSSVNSCWNGFEVTADTLTVEGALVTTAGMDSVIRVVFKEQFDPREDSMRFVRPKHISCKWESGQQVSGKKKADVEYVVKKSPRKEAILITYNTKVAGALLLTVRFGLKEIDGSPFIVVVSPGETDPSQCIVQVQSFQAVTVPMQIFVNIRDKFGNEKLAVEDDRNSFVAVIRSGEDELLRSKISMRMGAKNGKTGLQSEIALAEPASEGIYTLSLYFGAEDMEGIALPGNPHQVYLCKEDGYTELRKLVLSGALCLEGKMDVPKSRIPRGLVLRHKGVGMFKNLNVRDVGNVDVLRDVPVSLCVTDQVLSICLRAEAFVKASPTLFITRVNSLLTINATKDKLMIYSSDLPEELTIKMKKGAGHAAAAIQAFSTAQPFEVSFLERVDVVRSILARYARTHRHFFKIQRHNIAEDSFRKLSKMTNFQMRAQLRIEFQDEPGIDMGGVMSEWYLLLMKTVFDPEFGLFEVMEETGSFMPSPNSHKNRKDDKQWFWFIGRMIGKAIHEGLHMDVHLTRAISKLILGRKLSQFDLEIDDPQLYRSGVRYLVENDITNAGLDLTFTAAEVNRKGEPSTVALKLGGNLIKVNEKNKHEYLELLANHKLYRRSQRQIQTLIKGIHSLVPLEAIKILSPQDLELLLCGLPSYEVEDLKSIVVYRGYRRKDPTIKAFWSVLEEFTPELKGKFLQFVTGTSKVPLAGVQSLKPPFAIHHAGSDTSRLPTGHTCFNQLHLPTYESVDEMRSYLVTAITEGNEFFGLS